MSDNNVFYSNLLKKEFSNHKDYLEALQTLVTSEQWLKKHPRIYPSPNSYNYITTKNQFVHDSFRKHGRFMLPYFHRKELKAKKILFPGQIYKVIKGTRKFTITDNLCGIRLYYHSTKSICYIDKVQIIDPEFLAQERLDLELNEKNEALGYHNLNLEDSLERIDKHI